MEFVDHRDRPVGRETERQDQMEGQSGSGV